MDDEIEQSDYLTVLERKNLQPVIFDGEELPEFPFNTLSIKLDGKMNADLNWEESQKKAGEAIEAGLAIFWEIDLGLFDRLRFPLENQTQYLALELSLDHFYQSIWKKFEENSIGICIYKGSAINLNDLHLEYLTLLATKLTDLPIYLCLDLENLQDKATVLQLLHPDKYELFKVILKNCDLGFDYLGWDQWNRQGFYGQDLAEIENGAENSVVNIGVNLPGLSEKTSEWARLVEAIDKLEARSLDYRLIAESQLTSKWDGLDYLIFDPYSLDIQGKRKLLGFCAAGGVPVSVDYLYGLPYEEAFEEWISVMCAET